MGFSHYRSLFRNKVAVDVGTHRIRIATGAFHLMESPSLYALHAGVIVDADAAARLIEPLLSKAKIFGIVKPHVLACAPSDATPAERGRLVDAITRGGATSVVVVPEPLAAAIGADVDVSSPYPQMVIDIGEGVTDCAIIRSSRVLASYAVRIGCAELRSALAGQCGVLPAEAEEILRSCGIAAETYPTGTHQSGYFADCCAAAVTPVTEAITAAVVDFLNEVPVKIGAELIDSGIVLTGGGALLPGMRDLIEKKTGIRTTCPTHPLTAVVRGAYAILPVVTALNQWP